MHGLEAHATDQAKSKTAMRLATPHPLPVHNRVMGFQPMSDASNSSQTTASLLCAETS